MLDLGGFNGMRVQTSIFLTVEVEDWSQVRSPSRARRRLKRGHRQRIVFRRDPDPKVYQMNGCLHMHPETLRVFRQQMSATPLHGEQG